MKRHFAALAIALCLGGSAGAAPGLGSLTSGQVIDGFQSTAVYLDGANHPIGARFVHRATGFTLDYIQMDSVPQGFVWVNTWPTSDDGEPHTQEHLLLGKGNQGRRVANLDSMSLTETGAFTMQWRTCYHLNTLAGAGTFDRVLRSHLDALLHPDYSDEEIRREVRNFGVTDDPQTHRLHLEEQGTVYNEMVSTYSQPDTWLWRALLETVYGPRHPLSFESGGTPAGLRRLTPRQIRSFHDRNYHLGHMGMVGCWPRSEPLAAVLRGMDRVLTGLEPPQPPAPQQAFPPPHPAVAGQVSIVNYPDDNEQQPESIMVAWPPDRELSTREQLLLELFADTLSGDATTNLYKRFVDTRTRTLQSGATGVWSFLSADAGHPLVLGLSGVPSSHITPQLLTAIRQGVVDELKLVASWPDGSPELLAFNRRVRSRIVERQRSLAKFVSTPPEFGFRSTGSDWMDHMLRLQQTGSFRRSLTLGPELAWAQTDVSGPHNGWRDHLAAWHLLDRVPYALGPHASSRLLAQDRAQHAARLQAELMTLEQRYHTPDDQTALRDYQRDYRATSAALEKVAAQVPYPAFVQTPPMTLDDALQVQTTHLGHDIPLVTSTFASMSGCEVGLALRLDGVSNDQLPFLAVLPSLLRQVGVVENGQPVSNEAMAERLKNEILDLSTGYSINGSTGRAELLVSGSGNNQAESAQAVHWMDLVLNSPDWRPDNLPRLRDVVDQELNRLRNVRQSAEENWVTDVSWAWRYQDQPLLLACHSFLTRVHGAQRVRWMLMAASDADRTAVTAFLDRLAGAADSSSKDKLGALLDHLQGQPGAVDAALQPYVDAAGALPVSAHGLVNNAVADLQANLAELPEATLGTDWRYLCHQMRDDLAVGPERALASLQALRQSLLRSRGARAFMSGPADQTAALQAPLQAVVASFSDAAVPALTTGPPLLTTRLQEREPQARPVYVGLVNPNSTGGVFLNSAPGIGYHDTTPDDVDRCLAFEMYTGHGAHSMFMKTWAAGLAYSNGLRDAMEDGRFNYYAERCPELPQTLSFVVGQLQAAHPTASLTQYAEAQVFQSHAAETYEARGEARANELADGLTPDVVRRFHQAVLAQGDQPGLPATLAGLLPQVDGSVLPGLGRRCSTIAGGCYFVIGADAQFDRYEAYLKTVEGPDVHLYRLYPRDFWLRADDRQN